MMSAKPQRSTQVSLAGALAAPWLLIWQGLDFTDQGYLLTGYRCFFRQPELTEDSGSTWLTNLVGATWDVLFGKIGVLGMRALWALCMSWALLIAFRAVASATSERVAALTVLGTSVFLIGRRETWFSYNTFSSLLFAATVACVVLGLSRRRRDALLGAGALIGLLPFARFPNILAVGLFLVPSLAALVEPAWRKDWPKQTLLLLAGTATSVGATFAAMFFLGHSRWYVASIRALFAPSAEESGYGMDSLLSNFLKDQAGALAWGLAVCAAGWVLAQLLRRVPKPAAIAVVIVVASLGAFGLAGVTERWRLVVPGMCYWLLGGISLGLWRPSIEMRLLAFAALVVLVIAPLGSNNGIRNAYLGLVVALPAALSILATLGPERLGGQGGKLALIACLVLAGEGAHRAATFTYRDGPRSSLRFAVAHRQLRAQFTGEARAKTVSEVLTALSHRVAPGDYLLASEGTPLLQYLTRTRPYLNRPWLMGAVPGADVARLAAEAPRRTGCLPVAVLTRNSTRKADWPGGRPRLEKGEPHRSVRAAIRSFMSRHRYRRVWDNGFFEIWEPPSRGRVECR